MVIFPVMAVKQLDEWASTTTSGAPWMRRGGLIIAGVLLTLTYGFGFVQRYNLMDDGHRRRQSVGTLTLWSNEGAYIFITSMVLLFALFFAGLYLVNRADKANSGERRQMFVLIVLGAVAFCLLLLPMYPVDASDIYDYIMRGRMAHLYSLNPMLDVPEQVRFDPFFPFTSWRRTPSAYGPVWELMAQAITSVTHDTSINAQVVAYKLLNIAGYAITALFIGLTLRRIAPGRVLVGLYIFLWNPLVVYMTVGTGHNDAVMTATIAAAVYFLTRKWFLTATVAATVGTLIKFIPALLLPVIALYALRELGWRRWLGYAVASVVVCGGMTALLYTPYWHGFDTVRASRRANMFTGSVASIARYVLMPSMDGVTDMTTFPRNTPNASGFLANLTLFAFGVFYLSQLVPVWRSRDVMTPIRVIGRIIMFYLLVVSIWFHAWYAVWIIALVALLEDTPLRRLALVFSYLVTWQSFMVTYFDLQTKSGEWNPWLDFFPVTIYMGFAWAFTAVYMFRWWTMRRRRHPADQAVGVRLREARERAGLSLANLSDELQIPYDVLEQYERGLRALSLDHGRKLAQRLDASLPEWLDAGVKA